MSDDDLRVSPTRRIAVAVLDVLTDDRVMGFVLVLAMLYAGGFLIAYF